MNINLELQPFREQRCRNSHFHKSLQEHLWLFTGYSTNVNRVKLRRKRKLQFRRKPNLNNAVSWSRRLVPSSGAGAAAEVEND